MKNTKYIIEDIQQSGEGFALWISPNNDEPGEMKEYRIGKNKFFYLLEKSNAITEYWPDYDNFVISYTVDTYDYKGEHIQKSYDTVYPCADVLQIVDGIYGHIEKMLDIPATWDWLYREVNSIDDAYKIMSEYFKPAR